MSDEPLRYGFILYERQDDDAFIAELPELPGCMSDGETPRQALDAIQTIAQEWIETARELGRPFPAPKGRLLFA